ncbi:hypothetical protein D3C78_1090530 [compost metagenome]
MRKHESYWQLHQSRQTYCWTEVVSKYEECTAEYFKSAMQCDTVHCSRHTKFTNAEVEITSVASFRCVHVQSVQMSHS